MKYTIGDLQKKDIDKATELFLAAYEREQDYSNLLPPSHSREKLIKSSLENLIGNSSVAIFENNELAAFMITASFFTFKGQKAAIVPEYGHGCRNRESKKELYRFMYKELTAQWIKEKIHLHIMGHLANDRQLTSILFQLGFGAILAERLRDLSPIENSGTNSIVEITDPTDLLDIQLEHNAFYRESPTFITKSLDRDEVYRDIKEQFDSGYRCFGFCEKDSVSGYMIVGKTGNDEEGYLLQHSNSAALHSAFIKPHLRGRGIGSELLNKSIKWARDESLERIMVEHETANFFGEAFWSRYFDPYIYFSIRYIDNSL